DQAEKRADEAIKRVDAADSDRRAMIVLADQTGAMLTDANARADRAEAALTGERQRADALRDRIDTQAAVVDGLKGELEQARQATQAAVTTADELQALDTARKARGRLRRILDAWRGE